MGRHGFEGCEAALCVRDVRGVRQHGMAWDGMGVRG